MAWLEFDAYSLLRFCGALAVLMAVYYLLFDRKARFRHCRYFLLSAVLVSVVAAVVRVPVYVPEQAVVLEFAGMPEEVAELSGDSGRPMAADPDVNGSEEGTVLKEEVKESGSGSMTWKEGWRRYAADAGVWLLAYAVVAGVLALRWLLAGPPDPPGPKP